MYVVKVISLENCPYSIAAIDLLKNEKINTKIINVTVDNKETFKNKEIKTFPQIYLTRNNREGQLLIGGYTDIKEIVDVINKNNSLDKLINFLTKKYPKWSRKAKLRLIKLFH